VCISSTDVYISAEKLEAPILRTGYLCTVVLC